MAQHLRRLLAGLMPTGLLGIFIALAPPAQAAAQPKLVNSPEMLPAQVSARLTAVRAVVTAALSETPTEPEGGVQKVWWGNGGWGRRWGCGNGGWGWHNGGWRNGGWGNWHPWGNL